MTGVNLASLLGYQTDHSSSMPQMRAPNEMPPSQLGPLANHAHSCSCRLSIPVAAEGDVPKVKKRNLEITAAHQSLKAYKSLVSPLQIAKLVLGGELVWCPLHFVLSFWQLLICIAETNKLKVWPPKASSGPVSALPRPTQTRLDLVPVSAQGHGLE